MTGCSRRTGNSTAESRGLSRSLRQCEFQAYGQTVILYTTYELDLTTGGKTRTERGAATEICVRQRDGWVNTGWQLAPR